MLNRNSPPPYSKSFSFELPQPEIIQLNDSLDLIFLNGLQQDVFKIEFAFKAGKWWESKRGLSHFTANLLEKGTTRKSSNEIASFFDYYGSQIEVSAGYDFTFISLFGLRKHFDKVFPLFLEIISEPSFPPEEFELQKEIFVQNLKINNEKNSFVASKLLRKNIFGSDHPYGGSLEESDVSQISVTELKDFFKQHFNPFSIYLAGNFENAQLLLLERSFQVPNLKENHSVLNPGPSIETLIKAESVQSSIRLGKRIINRNHPDYFSLLLLNHVLGGYFGSRLMKNIREEKGLTYGIYSSITPFKNDCLLSIGADVSKDKKELAAKEIKNEVSRLGNEFIPSDELFTAMNHFLGSIQLEIANPFAALDKVKTIRLNQLGSDYYKNLSYSILNLSPDALKATAEKYFSVDGWFEVYVG